MVKWDASADACDIARGSSLLGDRWTVLIVRDALRGHTKFAEFADSLPISAEVLTDRLRKLVAAGVLVRKAYHDPGDRRRSRYLLTDAGRQLIVVLGAVGDWGQKHVPVGLPPATQLVERSTGQAVRAVLVRADGSEVGYDEVQIVPVDELTVAPHRQAARGRRDGPSRPEGHDA